LKTAHRVREHRAAPALAAGLIAALWAAAPAQAADIVYSIDQSGTTPIVGGENSPLSDTEIGTITTNGTIGVLTASDIVSWNLALTDKSNAAYDVTLNSSNSGISSFNGNGLTASATALSFNYSDAGADFGIQGTKYGFYSGYQYVCFSASAGACAAGNTIVPYYYATDGVQVALTGTQNLGGSGGGGGTSTHSAPEIDSASAMTGLTLLLGVLAVIRGRRAIKFGGAMPA
jgi:hypothetical protein